MSDLRLLRLHCGRTETLGELSGEGLHLRTLELPWRRNERNRSCIPTGEYCVVQRRSPKFGSVAAVDDVDGRSHILFHAGNTAAHTRGCILLGTRHGILGGHRAVLCSMTAMRLFLTWLEGCGGECRLAIEGD